MTTTSSSTGLTSVSGLASGVDTSGLVTQLMSVAAQPQNQLKSRLSALTTQITALQKVNTQTAAVAAAAKALSTASTWTATSATSSSSSVTATATGTGAATGSLTFDVTGLATRHSMTTDAVADPGDGSTPSLVLTDSSGVAHALTPASWKATDLAAAIAKAGLGVSATTVDGGSRLLVTADGTGAKAAFGLRIDAVAGDGTTTAGAVPARVLSRGRDAELLLGDGTTVTSSTNTFTGLLAGVDVAVTKQESGVTVSVAKDPASTTSQVSTLFSGLNVLLANIAFQTRAAPSTTSGEAGTGGGPLVGEGTLRGVQQSLLAALATTTVKNADGTTSSAAAAGISVDRDGNATFDQTAFTSLLASDPVRARSLVTALAAKLDGIAKAASDPYSGSISQLVQGDQRTSTSLTKRIADWDDRLALRQSTLTRQFTAMETALARLQSQSGALTAALASLTSD